MDFKIQEANIPKEVLDAIKGTLKSFSGAVEEAATLNDVREALQENVKVVAASKSFCGRKKDLNFELNTVSLKRQ